MAPTGLTVAIGLVGGSGLLAAEPVAGQSTLGDVALLIGAITGLITGVGALFVALRPKKPDPLYEAALQILIDRAKDDDHEPS